MFEDLGGPDHRNMGCFADPQDFLLHSSRRRAARSNN
jgi:hypothetical protein